MAKRARVLSAIIAAVAAPVFAAPAAMADSTEITPMHHWGSCSNSGNTNDPGARCTSLSNGTLYVRKSADPSVTVQYYKSGGSSIYARLGFEQNGQNTWDSYKTMTYASEVVNRHFSRTWGPNSVGCTPVIGKLHVQNGTTYPTPTLGMC
ncbi:hypothetical protein MTQ13_23390 [Streptomyces sp. XM4011]|uniref:hypothetical protein n=1 Tax=Streptomyces sp. XM4011 TaxID=2929780 RepID=UPI001FFBB88E|nr:hypothetical protein [Streptomyces sp. XM4011]MCK1817188.1 hypothetical protein [Streptomyces sp. XM4011]